MAVLLAVAKCGLEGKSLMVMGHAIHEFAHQRKVTCVSDVSWGRGPSFLRFQSKQKGHQFPSKFLFSFYIHNSLHIQTKDQSTYTKTTFNKQIQPLKWTQFRKLTVACISSLMQYNTWLTCILKERSQLGHRHRQEHCGLHF